MGAIIFWTIVRILLFINIIWFSKGFLNEGLWWAALILGFYVAIVHPAYSQLKNFFAKNKTVIENSICSSCQHFDTTAVLCIRYDDHPTETFIPCDGNDWESISEN